jgi:uncharacterized protein (TIGR02246 family)
MSSDENEIRELVQRWMTATKTGDTETVLRLMADDAVFLVAGRTPFGKDEFQANSKQLAASEMQFEGHSEILELKIFGDWAFMISKLSVTTNQPGKPSVNRSGNTLTIFKKVDGKWLLSRDANLLTPDQG